MQAFGNMGEVRDNLFFGNSDPFGEIPHRERVIRKLGHDALPQGFVSLQTSHFTPLESDHSRAVSL